VDELESLVDRRRLALRWGQAHARRRHAKEAELAQRSVEENLGFHLMEARSSFDRPDEPESEGGLGVREPRRPRPSGSSDATALPKPDSDDDA
jgi:hypothetical protein